MVEAGLPGLNASSWQAVFSPKGTSKAIVEKVRAESLKVLADPEMVKKFAVMGLDPVGSTGEETKAAIVGDILKWAKVVEDAGIKAGP